MVLVIIIIIIIIIIILYLYVYDVGLVQHNIPGKERLSNTVGESV